jgi:sec-independent protein translocase protein TatB
VFGIGWSELLVIALAILVFLGPKDLPRLFNRLGRLMRELQTASRELRNQLETDLTDVPDPRKIADELADEAKALAGSPYAEIREIDAQLKGDIEKAGEAPAKKEDHAG